MSDNTSRAQPASQTSEGQLSGCRHSAGRASRAGRRRGTAGQVERRCREGSQTPPRAHTPLPRTEAAPGHQQDPPRSHTGPSERECVPAPAPQNARARSARHTQTRQSTHSAPHTSTHHEARPNSTTPDTHARQRASHHDQAPHSPQRKSSRPYGRVSTWWQTRSLPATKQPPSGWTCARPAVNPAPAGYKTVAVRMEVCAPGSEPSSCRLRNSRRPDGRVCARQ